MRCRAFHIGSPFLGPVRLWSQRLSIQVISTRPERTEPSDCLGPLITGDFGPHFEFCVGKHINFHNGHYCSARRGCPPKETVALKVSLCNPGSCAMQKDSFL